ncbi:N-acetylglucosamine kinase [Kalamiella sp. sgz302252]|uniref:N-acetylglucosamine kinase n=1 Tax=Pantoea sp. sgz302252 TaxID=3341827 RepID=UPI0036D420FA
MYYGFDVGGSKIALGVYNERREQIWSKRLPTPTQDYALLLDRLAALTEEADLFCGERGSVGIGIPGLPIPDEGTVFTANIPAAQGQRLQADLSARLGREVRIDNDANCFALSEAWDEEFRAYPVVLGLILGTGVGGGLIINGRPLTGRNFVAGEFGHMRLPLDALEVLGHDVEQPVCGCGKRGCIEPWLSGPGFSRLWRLHYQSDLSAPAIASRYYQQDKQAVAHTERYQALLAVCLANWLTLVDPHLVVVGGGLSGFNALYDGLEQQVARHLLPRAKPPRIAKARHGDAGGTRGAAFLHIQDQRIYDAYTPSPVETGPL